MKISTCLLSFFLVSSAAHYAQSITPEVISSNGGSSQGTGGGIAWTIGETVNETYTSNNNITTVGFHQPEMEIVEMINEYGKTGQVFVYPNPVQDQFRVNLAGLQGEFLLELSDAAGRIISRFTVNTEKNTAPVNLQMPGIAAGTYLLKVQGKSTLALIKINKVN